jgi:hypothetical protein
MKGRPIIVEYQGEPRSLAEIGSVIGVPRTTLTSRYAAGKRGADLFAPLNESKKFDAGELPPTDADHDDVYLARFPLGSEKPTVTAIDSRSVQLRDHNKRRASIVSREARAWWFDATRTSLGRQLCPPGAAAIGFTSAEAIAAAMRLMSQYQRAVRCGTKTEAYGHHNARVSNES